MMRSTLLAVLVGAAVPMLAFAQTADELKNDDKTPGDVLTYGMGYSLQRYSPLSRINRDNVKRLVPAWSYSMADNNGQQSHALMKDGVMYITDHAKTVALDVLDAGIDRAHRADGKAAVAAALRCRRALQHHDRGALLARGQRRRQAREPSTDDQHIGTRHSPPTFRNRSRTRTRNPMRHHSRCARVTDCLRAFLVCYVTRGLRDPRPLRVCIRVETCLPTCVSPSSPP